MEYIYGALLLHTAGQEIDEEKLKKVLSGAGVKPDETRLKSLISSLKDIKIEEVLKNAANVSVAAPAASAAKPAEKKEEKKKEEKKEEKSEAAEEDAMAGLSSLFG
ncbi:MAG: 50S ribosomal protein P1 [Thermoplasmatales archaeon B_DKE]|nr:MAG: 50S ribosomal protein P1 [Thermoplasmatales archaeon B_DKE]QRF75227.1 Ribosomal protein 'A' [Thermoplasmatales archaeon]